MSAVVQWLRLTAACPTALDAPARYNSRRAGCHRRRKRQRTMSEPHSQQLPAAEHITQQFGAYQHEAQQPSLNEQCAQQAQHAQQAQQAQHAAQALHAQQPDDAEHQHDHNTHRSVPADLHDQDMQDQCQLGAASTGTGTVLHDDQPGLSSMELDAGLRQTALAQQFPPTRISSSASAVPAVPAASAAPSAGGVQAAEPNRSSLPVQTGLTPQQEFMFMDMLSQLRGVMFEDVATDFMEDLPAAGKHLVALTFVSVPTCTCGGEDLLACQSVQSLATIVLYVSTH